MTENFQKKQKRKQPWHFPVPVLWHVSLNVASLSNWKKYCHLHCIVFISDIGLSLNIFGNCLKQPLSHIFESGMKISPINMSWHKTKFFNPQTWDSCLRHEIWQVDIKEKLCRCSMEGIYTIHSHCLSMGNFLWLHTHKETSKRQE